MPDPGGESSSSHRVACPACRTIYGIRTELLGKKLRCAKCKTEWRAIAPETLQAAQDQVSDLDAELMDSNAEEKTATLSSKDSMPTDHWLGKHISRYKVRSILGTGAVGHVYCAHDDELGRDVAIKILPKPKAEQMTVRVKLFLQEARAAARLQHPNIVTIYEVGLDGDHYYFAMEVVDGGTLKDLTLAMDRLSPARACFLIGQSAQALAYAHGKGVIHRDIKPDNLMMDRRGAIKVADFGLAEIGEFDIMKLYQNRPIGTPGYIAPETARGQGADSRSDIYCLGLCLYHALTGQKLLSGENVKETLKICADPPLFEVGAELDDVPYACLRILEKCLEHNPQDRYQDAQELADDLKRFVIEASREDSRSRLPIPGDDPFRGKMGRPPRSRLSSMLIRAGRYLQRRRDRNYKP